MPVNAGDGERRHRRTQAERSASTRAALLASARDLFASRGFSATGREEIVERAGVTRGALYHHFADKVGVFRAVYEQMELELLHAVAVAAMAAGDDPLDQLRAGSHAYLDAALDPAVQRICVLDGPAVLPSDVREEIAGSKALGLVRESLAAGMQAGRVERRPVEPLARMLLAALMAAAQQVATSPDHAAARAEAGEAVDFVLGRLAPRP